MCTCVWGGGGGGGWRRGIVQLPECKKSNSELFQRACCCPAVTAVRSTCEGSGFFRLCGTACKGHCRGMLSSYSQLAFAYGGHEPSAHLLIFFRGLGLHGKRKDSHYSCRCREVLLEYNTRWICCVLSTKLTVHAPPQHEHNARPTTSSRSPPQSLHQTPDAIGSKL